MIGKGWECFTRATHYTLYLSPKYPPREIFIKLTLYQILIIMTPNFGYLILFVAYCGGTYDRYGLILDLP